MEISLSRLELFNIIDEQSSKASFGGDISTRLPGGLAYFTWGTTKEEHS